MNNKTDGVIVELQQTRTIPQPFSADGVSKLPAATDVIVGVHTIYRNEKNGLRPIRVEVPFSKDGGFLVADLMNLYGFILRYDPTTGQLHAYSAPVYSEDRMGATRVLSYTLMARVSLDLLSVDVPEASSDLLPNTTGQEIGQEYFLNPIMIHHGYIQPGEKVEVVGLQKIFVNRMGRDRIPYLAPIEVTAPAVPVENTPSEYRIDLRETHGLLITINQSTGRVFGSSTQHVIAGEETRVLMYSLHCRKARPEPDQTWKILEDPVDFVVGASDGLKFFEFGRAYDYVGLAIGMGYVESGEEFEVLGIADMYYKTSSGIEKRPATIQSPVTLLGGSSRERQIVLGDRGEMSVVIDYNTETGSIESSSTKPESGEQLVGYTLRCRKLPPAPQAQFTGLTTESGDKHMQPLSPNYINLNDTVVARLKSFQQRIKEHLPDQQVLEIDEIANRILGGDKSPLWLEQFGSIAMSIVGEELRGDPDYAWSWYCNLKMAAYDSGATLAVAAETAVRFLRAVADLDITQHEHYATDNRDPRHTHISYGTIGPVFAVVREMPSLGDPELTEAFRALLEEHCSVIDGLRSGGVHDRENNVLMNPTSELVFAGPDDNRMSRARTIEQFMLKAQKQRASAEDDGVRLELLCILPSGDGAEVVDAWVIRDARIGSLESISCYRDEEGSPYPTPDYRLTLREFSVFYGEDIRERARAVLKDRNEQAQVFTAAPMGYAAALEENARTKIR